jgi:serine/threonine protein kinase
VAPEVIELKGAVFESDIWSLGLKKLIINISLILSQTDFLNIPVNTQGCTIIELLTGNPPYFEMGVFPAMFKITQDEHPPLPSGITSNCHDFLLKTFVKNPEQRSTAKQLLSHKWLFRKIPSFFLFVNCFFLLLFFFFFFLLVIFLYLFIFLIAPAQIKENSHPSSIPLTPVDFSKTPTSPSVSVNKSVLSLLI